LAAANHKKSLAAAAARSAFQQVSGQHFSLWFDALTFVAVATAAV
jgi:hypothetical protein